MSKNKKPNWMWAKDRFGWMPVLEIDPGKFATWRNEEIVDRQHFLEIGKSMLEPVSNPYKLEDPTLPKILEALGWQGGTVEQAVQEIRRLKFNSGKVADRIGI